MTRLIGGSAGGRRLATPSGEATRPTSDRVREAVFSSIEHELGAWGGRRFLDLYAGSGAVGLEALSRGAASAVLVEHDRRVLRLIHDNVTALGFGEVATVVPARVERLVASPPQDGRDFDVAFLDPPYQVSTDAVVTVLDGLRRNGWLAPEALVLVERSARSPDLMWPPGYEPGRSRRYGETSVWYGRVTESVTLRPT